MHTRPSEASVLRDLLKKEMKDSSKFKELLAELDVECDVSRDSVWNDQFHCSIHAVTFRDHEESYICPVGQFARELKSRYE
jgi:hypothetical protein